MAAPVHPWNVTPAEARAIQDELRGLVIAEDDFPPPATVAGVDVGFEANKTITRAAVAVLSYPDLKLVETAIARRPVTFPYVPGLLSFREVPAIMDALGQLRALPDLVLCDGQGVAHPRRFGLACHLGVLTGLPTIGVAKSRLIGTHNPVPREKHLYVRLFDKGEVIGAVVRTQNGVEPLYVSVGHRISLWGAIEYALRCAPRYRLPETTRQAHRLASR